MSDPYRQHNSDGMINSLSAELEKVKAELVAEKAKTKELEQTLDDERAAINDGWEYKLVHQTRHVSNTTWTKTSENGSSGSTTTVSLSQALLEEQKYKTTKGYVVEFLQKTRKQLSDLGKQGWEFIKQDDEYKDVLWFRRKIKVKEQTE